VLVITAIALACQPSPAASAPAKAPAARTQPAPLAPVLVDVSPLADAGAFSDAPDAGHQPSSLGPPGPGAGLPRALPSIEIEPPYRLWERPREKGDVLAAGRDEELARWNLGGTGDPAFISNRPGFHPGARVRVDATAVGVRLPERAPRDRRTGRAAKLLTAPALVAELRKNGYWPYRLCFEEGLRKDQKLKGETVLRADVDANGRVTSARVLTTKLGDSGVPACLARKTQSLQVSAPRRRISVKIEIKLWPGDARVPSLAMPEGTSFENPGRLDAAAVTAAAATVTADIAACYAAGLDRDAGLWGRIEFRVDLDAQGRVRSVAENESRFPDREVVRCASGALGRAPFPVPKAGALSFVYAVRLGQIPAIVAPIPAATPIEASPANSGASD